MSITGVTSAGALAVDGHFVFIGAGSDTIVSYNDNSDVVASTSTLPASNISAIALAPPDGYIYVQVSSGLTSHFYRSTYDNTTGALGGAWTDITSNVGVTSGKYSGIAIELSNVSDSTENFSVTIYNTAGETVSTATGSIPAKGTQHVAVSGLGSGLVSGAAKITSTHSDRLIANLATYFLSATGTVDSAFIKEPQHSSSGDMVGAYNRYFGTINWLRLFNTGSTTQTATVTVYDAQRTAHPIFVELPAKNGYDLPLHQDSYGTATESYGAVTVSGTGVIADNLRILGNVGSVNFFMSTSVR